MALQPILYLSTSSKSVSGGISHRSDDDEDDEAALILELEQIRKERTEEKLRKEQRQREEELKAKEAELLRGNPLLNNPTSFNMKRGWDDDVVFNNQARGETKTLKRFINDTIRNGFHRKFLVLLKNKKLQTKEILRISVDISEGIKFMNDHGIAYRDLNTHRILLDRHGNACLGDMGIVAACKSVGEAMEYETDGYRWLAPEIIAGDPESVSETWMSNVYSFGMIIWEMVTGEAAYAAYSPVQAAVGIAACGLRPEIPKDCPQVLKSLMTKCWNNIPSKRPQFSDIISILLRPNNSSNKQ